ncbi:hypothetical protein F2Q69_00062152 [Brassica cretica]|uniref:Reverse transcriptase zinc-binding domain-containing protein n=1 Tax=Brassica cretica TaxID=69181 RepID=A0A8S9RGE1_BRACR|nr:hypothetical protein F2Q69_00062152 [Brassica cretica]
MHSSRLAIRDRLSTGHCTSSWSQPQCCILCGEPDETRDHFFFAWPYTFMVWLKLAENLFGLKPNPDWETALSRLLTGSYDRLTFILLRLALDREIIRQELYRCFLQRRLVLFIPQKVTPDCNYFFRSSTR